MLGGCPGDARLTHVLFGDKELGDRMGQSREMPGGMPGGMPGSHMSWLGVRARGMPG